MKKPSWFRLVDLLTIGLGGIVSLGLLIYAAFSGVQGPHAKEGLCLTAVVGLCFIGIWLVFALQRKKWLSQFIWYPRYGFMVSPGGYLLPHDNYVLDTLIKRTIEGWTPYHPNAEAIVKSEINWVWFDKTLNETVSPMAGRLCKGFTISGTHCFMVDYDKMTDPLESTAFEHELGHVIHGNATNQWDQAEHHAFAAAHDLK
jgi:hypothetical protein